VAVQDNPRKSTAGLWSSPAVRAIRLGGLCVVAAAGLMAAGALVVRQPTASAGKASLALLVLPGLALGALAIHRAVRLGRG
jgi:hypothetical protein